MNLPLFSVKNQAQIQNFLVGDKLRTKAAKRIRNEWGFRGFSQGKFGNCLMQVAAFLAVTADKSDVFEMTLCTQVITAEFELTVIKKRPVECL